MYRQTELGKGIGGTPRKMRKLIAARKKSCQDYDFRRDFLG
jgi:hypothetical protein